GWDRNRRSLPDLRAVVAASRSLPPRPGLRTLNGAEPGEQGDRGPVRLDLAVPHLEARVLAGGHRAAVPEPQVEAVVAGVPARGVRVLPRPVPPLRVVVVGGELDQVAEEDRVVLRR